MPKRTDLQSILILGFGPIVTGQAAEFDYGGTQAVRALPTVLPTWITGQLALSARLVLQGSPTSPLEQPSPADGGDPLCSGSAPVHVQLGDYHWAYAR
jgi:hypothetical protein